MIKDDIFVEIGRADAQNSKKKSYFWAYFIAIGIVLVSIFIVALWSYRFGVVSVVVPSCDLNDSMNKGFVVGYNSGVDYAVNGTINSLLYYSRNCSIVSMNVSGSMYGFLDVTCLNNQDAMKRILG